MCGCLMANGNELYLYFYNNLQNVISTTLIGVTIC